MATKPTIVLVHGAFQDGPGAWGRVRPLLEAAGHPVTVVTLPGRGGDGADPEALTLNTYRDAVLAGIGDPPEPVVLVGHSFGGMTISAVAEAAPDRVRVLVYLAAYLPADGQSMLDLAKQDRDSLLGVPGNLVLTPDYALASINPGAKAEVFCNDATPADRDAVVAGLIPEPAGPQGMPVALTPGRWGRVPKVYVHTARDRCVSPYLQGLMVSAAAVGDTATVDAGHAASFTQPSAVAAAILAAAE